MRHNYYYIANKTVPNGQTWTTRPESAGTQAHRHAQSTSRSRGRSLVQREPLLRSQRPSPGSLRDAAAAQRRRNVDSRFGGRFWCLSAHLLSSTSSFQSGWSGRLVAQSAWSKGWSQGNSRRSRLRSKLEGSRTWADHRPVRPSRPGTLWSYPPPAQSRASSCAEQKKTGRTDLNLPLPTETAAAYEAMRAHLVDLTEHPGGATGCVILLRRGLLAWARACNQPPDPPAPLCPPVQSPVPSKVATELVQFIAGLILSSGKDSCYA